MPGIKNNLYPPIIASWMPAFIRTTPCKVYFSLSDYNSIEDIRNAQVIINYQNNNLSALDTDQYPTNIKIANINTDDTIKGNNKYYIIIDPNDLEGGEFELNQYYKIQIRFTSTQAEPLIDSKKIASWLVNNQQYFSEWSTVCVIRGIEQPRVYIKGFESDSADIVFTSSSIRFIGQMYYELNADVEKEYLKSYQIDIYSNIDNKLIYSSGTVYTEIYNPNEINYTFSYLFEDGIEYRAEITYTTNNDYQDVVSYIFSIISNAIDTFNATVEATPEEEYGRMKVHVFSEEKYFGNLAIRRASNKTNFTIWEDVKILLALDSSNFNITWYDYTVESGIWYKYCIQKIGVDEERGALVQTNTPSMIILDDMFLTQDNFQLRVRYDPTIASFKHIIPESVTETIGSKYPFFKRNGMVNYRQFPISGLITQFCDDEGVFLNKDNIYQDARIYYDRYNRDENINEYQDYIYEREFRNKIIDFLYEDNVKLFRSTTEGNVLVKLMNVSFTPNPVLGRMLYSFTADAYEVDECSIDSYNKYNILKIGKVDPYVELVYDKLGQLSGTFAASQNILTSIQDKMTDSQDSGYIDTVKNLSWLRLSFNSDPYPVRLLLNGTMEPVLNGDIDDSCLLGYIAYVNGNPIFINRKGYYELFDEDTIITSLYFPIETDVMIDYIGEVVKKEEEKRKVVKLSSTLKVGQVYNIYSPEDTVIQQIYSKYHASYESFYQDLLAIDKISIEGIPGTVVFIKDSYDDKYDKHVIGDTSRLTLYKDDAVFMGMYFSGIHLTPALDKSAIRFNEYIETGISAETEDKVKNIVDHGAYIIGGERKIYYNNQWYSFNESDDVTCPVEALIDYEYEIIKGEY